MWKGRNSRTLLELCCALPRPPWSVARLSPLVCAPGYSPYGDGCGAISLTLPRSLECLSTHPSPSHSWPEGQENPCSPLPAAKVPIPKPMEAEFLPGSGWLQPWPCSPTFGRGVAAFYRLRKHSHYSLLFWHSVSCAVPISSGIKVSLLGTSVLRTYSWFP